MGIRDGQRWALVGCTDNWSSHRIRVLYFPWNSKSISGRGTLCIHERLARLLIENRVQFARIFTLSTEHFEHLSGVLGSTNEEKLIGDMRSSLRATNLIRNLPR